MWKTIVVVVVLIAGVLAFAATRPDDFTVRRSIAIKAEPAKIYPLLVDFGRWPAWSPWEKLDPTMKRTLSGAPSGKGLWRSTDAGVANVIPRRQLSGASGWTPDRIAQPRPIAPSDIAGVPSGYFATTSPHPASCGPSSQ